MKKQTITTTLISLALAASIGANIYQAQDDKNEPPTIRQEYITDEPGEQIATPPNVEAEGTEGRGESRLYAITTTYAITYKIEGKSGTPGGYTVTVAHVDHAAPRFLRTRGKPGVKDVPASWAPDLSTWENVISVEVKSVEAEELKKKPG